MLTPAAAAVGSAHHPSPEQEIARPERCVERARGEGFRRERPTQNQEAPKILAGGEPSSSIGPIDD